MERYDEAFEQSDQAVELDPVSPMSYINRGMLFFRARPYDESIQASRQALDLDPGFVNALWWQGLSYSGNLDFPRSIACLTKATMNDGRFFGLHWPMSTDARETERKLRRWWKKWRSFRSSGMSPLWTLRSPTQAWTMRMRLSIGWRRPMRFVQRESTN
jgi:tetratricopeptide (TPR) repeat protein